jgi:hypothetical protein
MKSSYLLVFLLQYQPNVRVIVFVNCTFQLRLYHFNQCYQQITAVVFFPAVDVDSVTGQVYWVNQVGDLPFVGMNTNGCTFTTCPIVAGSRQSYVYQLSISKKFPVVSGGTGALSLFSYVRQLLCNYILNHYRIFTKTGTNTCHSSAPIFNSLIASFW